MTARKKVRKRKAASNRIGAKNMLATDERDLGNLSKLLDKMVAPIVKEIERRQAWGAVAFSSRSQKDRAEPGPDDSVDSEDRPEFCVGVDDVMGFG